jgi:outer membrane receptor protein involved in Fe transport
VAALAGITTVIAVPAAAQTTGVLTGTVSDPSGAPVADAVVAIVSSAGVSVATLRTSPAGEYRSEGLDPGSYRIRVQRDGFNPLDSGPYEVSAGNVARHDLRLDIQTFGEELVVTATRGQEAAVSVPASVSSVTMDRLLDNGFYVAADELRGQPGFSFRRAEGDNDDFLLVSTRGVTGNHGNDTFLALVDGIPFVGGDEEVTMGDVPYAALERLEMVRGPVSALYGGGHRRRHQLPHARADARSDAGAPRHRIGYLHQR